MTEHKLRRELVDISHRMYQKGYLVAQDGNLSARFGDDLILCTKAGCHKGLLTTDDFVVCDLAGNFLRGQGRPTSELPMHIACYDERPDVTAVLHAHPPMAIAFTLANISLESLILPEVVLTLGTIPTVPYATTGTQELADTLRAYVRERDVVVMDRHGAVSLGQSALDAFCKLETLEHTASIVLAANLLGGAKELPTEESIRLRTMGLNRYGGPPEAVAKVHLPHADLPNRVLQSSSDPYPSPAELTPHTNDSRSPHEITVQQLVLAIQREFEAVMGTE